MRGVCRNGKDVLDVYLKNHTWEGLAISHPGGGDAKKVSENGSQSLEGRQPATQTYADFIQLKKSVFSASTAAISLKVQFEQCK